MKVRIAARVLRLGSTSSGQGSPPNTSVMPGITVRGAACRAVTSRHAGAIVWMRRAEGPAPGNQGRYRRAEPPWCGATPPGQWPNAKFNFSRDIERLPDPALMMRSSEQFIAPDSNLCKSGGGQADRTMSIQRRSELRRTQRRHRHRDKAHRRRQRSPRHIDRLEEGGATDDAQGLEWKSRGGTPPRDSKTARRGSDANKKRLVNAVVTPYTVALRTGHAAHAIEARFDGPGPMTGNVQTSVIGAAGANSDRGLLGLGGVVGIGDTLV